MQCACGGCPAGTLILHGSYKRCVKTTSGKIPLIVRRVKCTDCNATHALLPSLIVPYSQVPLADHAAIAAAKEDGKSITDILEDNGTNPELTASQIWYILASYIRCWQQRILSERIPLSPLHALAQSCLSCFSRAFMQIKTTPNILFVPPT